MLILIKSRTRSQLGHVGSKTRSLGQIFEKPIVHSRGHSFDPNFMKLYPLSDKCETGAHWKYIGHLGISLKVLIVQTHIFASPKYLLLHNQWAI